MKNGRAAGDFVTHTRHVPFFYFPAPLGQSPVAMCTLTTNNGSNHVATNVRDDVTMVQSVFESADGTATAPASRIDTVTLTGQDEAFEAALVRRRARKLPGSSPPCSCSRRAGPKVAQPPCRDSSGSPRAPRRSWEGMATTITATRRRLRLQTLAEEYLSPVPNRACLARQPMHNRVDARPGRPGSTCCMSLACRGRDAW